MTNQKKLRILMINDHIYFGGGGDATFRYERDIYKRAGYEVFTFSHTHRSKLDISENDIVHIESSNRIIQRIGKYTFNLRVYYSLKHALKQIKPSFVHLHLISKYPASIYAALRGYSVVQTLHGSNHFCATAWGCLKKNSGYCELGIGAKCYLRGCIPLWQLPLVWWTYLLCRPFAKRVVKLFLGPSRQICKAAERVGFGPVEYMPLCVDKIFHDVKSNRRNHPPTVVYAGNLSEQKGVYFLLRAFRLVLQEIPKARLIYAGRGQLLERLKKSAVEYSIEKSIDFLGFVDHKKIPEIYSKGHVLALPSIWSEQFGLVGPESLMCGLPCVASNIGGIPEWLKDGQWGYLVPPRDEQALADKIILLLKNRQLCEEFVQRGREFVLREYGTKKFKNNILSLAERFITNP